MEISSDVFLRGPIWNNLINNLSDIFSQRTRYSIFVLCISIGIMYDQRIEKFNDDGYDPGQITRNLLRNSSEVNLDFMFQAAILSTETETMDEKTRLELAFGEGNEFNKIGFLTQFANYGATKLSELIGSSPIESMENIKNFLASSVEGRNLDIDALPDDILLTE